VPLAAAGGRGGYPGAPPRGQAHDGFARPLGARGAPEGGPVAPGNLGADVEAVAEERHAWLAYLLNRFGSRGGFDVLVKARARRPRAPCLPGGRRARCDSRHARGGAACDSWRRHADCSRGSRANCQCMFGCCARCLPAAQHAVNGTRLESWARLFSAGEGEEQAAAP
jgi:hypothetical protein